MGTDSSKVLGVKNFLKLPCGIRDVGPEFIGSSVFAVRQGNSAGVLGFVEVDSLGNDRGNSWAVETGLSPECEDSEG